MRRGYWLVWAVGSDSVTHVEFVMTFERAREMWRDRLAQGCVVSEVYAGDDGQVLLHVEQDRWSMSYPRMPGRFRWDESAESFARLR